MLAEIAVERGLSVFHTSQGAFCAGRKGLVTPHSPQSISLQMGQVLSAIPPSSQKSNVAPVCDSSHSPAALSPDRQACSNQITAGLGCRCCSTNAPLQEAKPPSFSLSPFSVPPEAVPPLLSHFISCGGTWTWVSSCSFPLPAPPFGFPLSSHARYCSHQGGDDQNIIPCTF